MPGIRAEIQRARLWFCDSAGRSCSFNAPGSITNSAEALLDRMLNKTDDLCPELRRAHPAG
jgi:hypothetical protein